MRRLLPDGTVDLARRVVCRGGTEARLTTMEARLLERLDAAKGAPVSPDTLLEEVWGYGPGVQSRTVRTTVGRLRKKLEVDPRAPQVLRTETGFGYRLTWADAPGRPVATAPSAPTEDRAALVARVEAALEQGPVCLPGAPGVGRSTVARAVAARHAGAVLWASCAAGGSRSQAVAEALGLSAPAEALEAAIPRALSARAGLLVVVEGGLEGDAAPLNRWVASGARVLVTGSAEGAQAVRVPPLAPAAAAALLERAWTRHGTPPEPALLAEIAGALGGLPLALEVAARAGAAVGAPALAAALREEGPASVAGAGLAEAVRAARRGLSAEEEAALAALAAFGGPVPPAALRQVAPAAGLLVLSRLVARGLVEPADEQGRVRMLGAIRAAVPQDAGATEAHARWVAQAAAPQVDGLHRADEVSAIAALQALRAELWQALRGAPAAAVAAPIPAALLELDCRGAGSPALARAADRWLEARQEAPGWARVAALRLQVARRGGVSAAVRARAEAFLARPAGGPVDHARLVEERLRVVVEGGGAAAARPLLEASVAAAQRSGSPACIAAARQSEALLERAWGDLPAGIRAAREAVAQADLGGGPSLRAATRRILADLLVDAAEVDEGTTHALDALDLLAGLSRPRLEASVQLTLGRLLFARRDGDGADAALARCATLAAAIASPRMELLAQWRRAVHAVDRDRPDDAHRLLDEVDRLMASSDDRSLLASALVTRGNAWLTAGSPERALTAHRSALDLQAQRGGALYLAAGRICAARSALSAGERALALSWATQGGEAMREAGVVEVADDAACVRALALGERSELPGGPPPTPLAAARRAAARAALGGAPLTPEEAAVVARERAFNLSLRFLVQAMESAAPRPTRGASGPAGA